MAIHGFGAQTVELIDDLGDGTHTRISGGRGYHAQTSNTRPNNATPYGAGDVVGATAAAWTFTNIGPALSDIVITSADLRIDVTSVPSGQTSFRLHLYNVTPPSAAADNDVWDLPAGDRASYLGYIDLGTPVDVGSTLFVQTDTSFRKEVRLVSTSLFAYLVTNGAFTPSAQAVKTVRLNALGA